jgi:UDP-glucose 4-epimerase
MKKIVIFGATGTTGSYFVRYLLERLDPNAYEIVGVGRRRRPEGLPDAVTYVRGDIGSNELYMDLPSSNVHAAVLLAAAMPASMNGYDPQQYILSNTLGALRVLEYSRQAHADRVLYTHTYYELGQYLPSLAPLRVDMPRRFSYTGDHAVYIISKNAAVDLVEHYHQEYGIKKYIFRLPTIYAYTRDKY